MNLKSKILAGGLAAIIAGFGIFAADINTAQAQTDDSNTNSAIAQMAQMVESLKQQIQQIIALITQLKPQETCGNGKCRFGETAATCPADCGTTINDNGKAKCSATGGVWKYSDCASGCVYNAKSERAVGGKSCAAVCIKDFTCECVGGKYWASREEGCIDADRANIAGGNCTYKTYTGTCAKTGTSADGISYTFTPFQTPDISGTFLTSASQINPYRGITDTWQIANLTQTSCELKVIASGTCTPIIMRLVLSFD